MPSKSFMGATIRRREDPRLITGSSTYVDDIILPGMMYMALLRSPYAHARIASIDTSAAAALPGVMAVFSGQDLGSLRLASGSGNDAEGGGNAESTDAKPERPILAVHTVVHVGEPVAAVIATSRAVAEDALAAIAMEYDLQPVVVDPESALEPTAPRVHRNLSSNATGYKKFARGDADAAFAAADVTITQRIVSPRLSPNPMEPRGVVAQYERGTAALTVWTSTQHAHGVRDNLMSLFDLPESRVRVIAPEVGGGFGCKFGLYPEDAMAAWAAMRLHRPIKWIEGRSEHLIATNHGRGQVAYISLAAQNDGIVTGLRVKVIGDLGAYGDTWLAECTATMITGCYDIPNTIGEAVSVYTHKTFLSAYRGAGRPEAAYYVERAMDILAHKMGMAPEDLRQRNFIAPENFPFKTHGWAKFDSGDYVVALDQALKTTNIDDLRAERAAMRASGRLVGIGLASYVEICGFGWDTGSVRVEPGGGVTLYTGVSPHGQGQETTFAQIAADVLGVDPNNVVLKWGDSHMGIGYGTGGSRGTAVGGSAIYKAALEVREKMRQIAAHLMEAAPDDLDLTDDGWAVKGVPGRSVTVTEIAAAAHDPAKLPKGMDPGLAYVTSFDPGDTTAPFGTHVAFVEVDRETGFVSVLKYVSVDDCGTIISPTLVDGQVMGGVAQGLSQALYEELVYDDEGQLLSGTLMDYNVPRAHQIPVVQPIHTHTPTVLNPLGVKGIGEAGTIGSTPVIVNAVMDALSPLGITHLDIPLTPQKLWKAITSAPGAV